MKKALAFLLTVLLIASLAAGCSSQTPGTSATPAPSDAPATESASPTEPEGPKAVQDGGEYKLPIVDSKVEFTAWNPWDVSGSDMTDMNDSSAYKKIEELANVHMKWFQPSSAQASENFNLSIASGDYYDTYMVSSGYLVGGPDYFVDNEVFLDLLPYFSQYAPNYEYVRNLDPNTLPTTVSDKGYAVGFNQLAKTLQWPWIGPLGRTDWLKQLNMEIPETYDELHTVLVAFRDQMKCEAPMALEQTGLDGWLMSGFDTMYIPSMGISFIQVDGQVRFGATEPGFKDYVTMLNQWYGEGLIDKEFYTRDMFSILSMNQAYAPLGKVGVGRALYTQPDFMPLIATTEGYEWNGFYPPVKAEGDVRKVSMESTAINLNKGTLGVISTNCSDVETLMRWYDYFYTEEGSILASFGIEGEGFTYIDGKPKTTELIYADKDGRAMNTMFPKYAIAQSQPMWYDWEREISPATSQNVWDTKDRFEKNWTGEWTMPAVSPTAEESSEYSAIMSDVNTYISENVVKFITGERVMTEFDAFTEQINSMGMDRAVEIQQTALDRFNNRIK